MSTRVVLLGAPGAGKGTQASRMAKRLGLSHLSTGDLLRAAVKAGTEAGLAAKESIEAGRLVSDEVVFGVLFESLESQADGFLLDGFPRNRSQAEELDRRLEQAGTPLDIVVDFEVPEAQLIARLTGRRICRACGQNYHMEFMPPKEARICDACGGELYERSDDSRNVVTERLAVYHEQTEPLRDYYRGRGLLATVNGDQDVDAVTTDLAACLEAPEQHVGGQE